MLISEKHNFIFIHVAKVAGQSVTNALMPYAAMPWQRALAMVLPYRYQLKVYTKLKQYSRSRIAFMPQPFSDHIRGPALRKRMGDANFDRYYSFAFVRHPYAWLLSQYTYAKKNPRHHLHDFVMRFHDFNAYCKWHCTENEKIKFQKDYIFDENERQVLSFFGRQERLNEDLIMSAKLSISRRNFHILTYHAKTTP